MSIFLVGIAAIMVAIGLVHNPNGVGWFGLGGWVFWGLVLAGIGLLLSVVGLFDGAKNRRP